MINKYFKCLVLIAFYLPPAINGFLFEKDGLFFVPSVAFRDPSTSNWIVHLQGWHYEENSITAAAVEKSFSLISGTKFDRDRVKIFAAEGKEDKTVCIDGLGRSLCLKTDKDGLIQTKIILNDKEIEMLRQPDGTIRYQASIRFKSLKTTGEIYLCDDNGLTFISDIDDTIKITEVSSTIKTLINTFASDFKSVTGMSETYRYWQNRYNGTFAYLTASPDQLYPFLRQFFDREQFPIGSAHMRHFTWLDVNFLTFFMSSNYMKKKGETLEMFLKNSRHRRFVLLGDVFQKDPDIYAQIYDRYPDRIAKIFIRKYADDADGQMRLESVFHNVPSEKWATFETGADLPREIV